MGWIRVCCRCNGLIYKGEGKYIPSKNYGNRYFMVHKTVTLCKERCDLRVPEDIKELMSMKEQSIKEWHKRKFPQFYEVKEK